MHIKHATHVEALNALGSTYRVTGPTKTMSVVGSLPNSSRNTKMNYGLLSRSTFASTINSTSVFLVFVGDAS